MKSAKKCANYAITNCVISRDDIKCATTDRTIKCFNTWRLKLLLVYTLGTNVLQLLGPSVSRLLTSVVDFRKGFADIEFVSWIRKAAISVSDWLTSARNYFPAVYLDLVCLVNVGRIKIIFSMFTHILQNGPLDLSNCCWHTIPGSWAVFQKSWWRLSHC